MELPKDLSWEIITNENGIEMITMPRFKMNGIVEYLKYADSELKKLRVADVSSSLPVSEIVDCGKDGRFEVCNICGNAKRQ